MKQTILAALLAAVASSALTLLLTMGQRPASGGATASEFKAALADLVGEVAALRREMAGGRGGTPAPDAAPAPSGRDRLPPEATAPGSVPAAAGEGEVMPVPVPGGEAALVMEEVVLPREERSAIPRQADLVERLRGLKKWEGSADIRGKWILASEEAVVSAFGKPDEIFIQENGTEWWNFRTPTGTRDEAGDPEWEDIMFELNRGRLVRVYD